MKRLYTAIAVLVVGVFATVGVPVSAAPNGYVNQADITITEAAYTKVTALFDETNRQGVTIDTLRPKITSASAALSSVENHTFSTKLGSTYSDEAVNLKAAAKKLREKINGMEAAIKTEDDAKITQYFAQLESIAKEYDTTIETLNASVEEANTSTGNQYLILLIATIGVAVAAFVWAFGLNRPTDQKLVKAKRMVAYASLAPVVGAAITYGSFTFASSTGGTYLIAWGPVLIGAVIMIRAIIDYVKLKNGSGKPNDKTPQKPTAVA